MRITERGAAAHPDGVVSAVVEDEAGGRAGPWGVSLTSRGALAEGAVRVVLHEEDDGLVEVRLRVPEGTEARHPPYRVSGTAACEACPPECSPTVQFCVTTSPRRLPYPTLRSQKKSQCNDSEATG